MSARRDGPDRVKSVPRPYRAPSHCGACCSAKVVVGLRFAGHKRRGRHSRGDGSRVALVVGLFVVVVILLVGRGCGER